MFQVSKISINVRDQDAAKRFWTAKMGYEVLGDMPMGGHDSQRWIEVRKPDDPIVLVLFTPSFNAEQIGHLTNILFECDDIQATFRELSANGVEFVDHPTEQHYGWWATFKDNEGNLYGLRQRD